MRAVAEWARLCPPCAPSEPGRGAQWQSRGRGSHFLPSAANRALSGRLCKLQCYAPFSELHPHLLGTPWLGVIFPGAPLCFLGEGCKKKKKEVGSQSQAQSQQLEHRGGARDGTLNWKCDLGGGRTGLEGCHLGAALALECLLIHTYTHMYILFNSLIVCNLGTLHSRPLLPLQPPRPSSALLVLGWGIRENLARLASVRKEAL